MIQRVCELNKITSVGKHTVGINSMLMYPNKNSLAKLVYDMNKPYNIRHMAFTKDMTFVRNNCGHVLQKNIGLVVFPNCINLELEPLDVIYQKKLEDIVGMQVDIDINQQRMKESQQLYSYTIPDNVVYTDASLRQSNAGLGIFSKHLNVSLKANGVYDSNEAELLSILFALLLHPIDDNLIIYTDSMCCIMCLCKKRDHIKYTHVIKSILQLCKNKNVDFKKVKAHANIYGNETADKLAGAALCNVHIPCRNQFFLENLTNMNPSISAWRNVLFHQ